MSATPKLRIVEATESKRVTPEAMIFGSCLLFLGVLIGAWIVTYQYRHAPPATCLRLLPDGRNLVAYDLAANGNESRCVYEQPKHDLTIKRKK